MRRRAAVVAVLALASLAACGDDGGESSEAAADPCDAARAVAELDDEFQREISDVMQGMVGAASPQEADAALTQLAARLEDLDVEPLLDAYADIEASVDGAPGETAETLRTFTERFMADLRATSSSEEIIDVIRGMGMDETALAAGEAALELDEWSQETCDVVIAD